MTDYVKLIQTDQLELSSSAYNIQLLYSHIYRERYVIYSNHLKYYFNITSFIYTSQSVSKTTI